MARILGGIGASHAPSMEHVYDRGQAGTEEWRPLFGAFEQVHRWLEHLRPDVLFVIYNDHFDHFWLDASPSGWPRSTPSRTRDRALATSRRSGATPTCRGTSFARSSQTTSTSPSARRWRSTTASSRRFR